MKPPNLDWNIMCPVCELPDPEHNPYCFCGEPAAPATRAVRDHGDRVAQMYSAMEVEAANNLSRLARDVMTAKIRAFEIALLYRNPFLFMAS